MEVRLLQFENAEFPIPVTVLGIVVFLQPIIKVFVEVSIIALQSFRESYLGFPLSTVIADKLSQARNGCIPIFVTDLGILMEGNTEQPVKDVLAILVTVLGIIIEHSLLQ